MNKISGESGKNDLFRPLLRDFGNLKSVLIDKILQKVLVKRQNFAEERNLNDEKLMNVHQRIGLF